jgi:outer membrane protein assembly factor BamA
MRINAGIVCILFISLFTLSCFTANAQKKKYSLRDTLDNALDASDFIINANGFIPVAFLITEPALGGFGAVVGPVFIKRRPAMIDTVAGEVITTRVAPDITGVFAGYTLNDTWMLGGVRMGTFVKQRLKYRLGAGYGDINMSYYFDIPEYGKDQEMNFNIKAIATQLQLTRRIAVSRWYLGMKYLFLDAAVTYNGKNYLEQYGKSVDTKCLISQPGAVIEYDVRDNIFTPDDGMKLQVEVNRSDNIFGSDFDYWRINYYTYMYTSFIKKCTFGLRIDGQQSAGDPPFFMKPYIDMRGVPSNRYSGNADILAEGELRWDFYKRWSGVFFSGSGKAFDKWNEFGDEDWVVSYGAGFRYLLARAFKLRMGIDVAASNDDWAYYIVFGSNWLK